MYSMVLETEQQKLIQSHTKQTVVSANKSIEIRTELPETLEESTRKCQESIAKYRR